MDDFGITGACAFHPLCADVGVGLRAYRSIRVGAVFDGRRNLVVLQCVVPFHIFKPQFYEILACI